MVVVVVMDRNGDVLHMMCVRQHDKQHTVKDTESTVEYGGTRMRTVGGFFRQRTDQEFA